MNDMISYLCYTAKNNEKALGTICKILKSQNKLNRTNAMFAVGATICLGLTMYQIDKQAQKIKKLETRLDELTDPTRGE